MALTNVKVQSAKPASKPVKLTDGGGLYLEVRPTGAKLWRYRYRIGGKENIFAIGQYYADKRTGHVSLEAARHSRDEARELVRQGIHPSHQRQQLVQHQIAQNENTFQAVALEWLARKDSSWAKSTARQTRHVLQTDVFPTIGSRPIASVTAADLLGILQRVEKRGAQTYALQIRQWSSAIFRYAVATLRADHDPAAALRGAIIRKKTRHCKALSKSELRLLLVRLKTYQGDPGTVFGIPLMILTFVRTIELRGACWSEIDFAAAEWRIPADRMKMDQEHIVPLSRQAIALLQSLHDLTGSGQYLFPNRRRRTSFFSATTINRALERMGFLGKNTIGFSGHGFRATASTILNEAGFRSDVVERQLAHQDRNQTRASYNRAAYLDERRQMMQWWADTVEGLSQPVPVQLEQKVA
jgi:integrase